MKKSFDELRERLCDEIDDIVDSDRIDIQTLDTIYKLLSSIKNLDKISEKNRSHETSRDGKWEMKGEYYKDDHYDREGSYRKRDGMGRYSRESMIDRIEELMSEASSDHERDALKKAMEYMR